ncbi:MAG: hypothetical protein LBM95_08850 [Lactobacillales bacterium]|jgi:hypothetical protein|nr:hypothetical protein [Lactobacillales bacterium]
MNKITDEEIQLKQLKQFRSAFLLQDTLILLFLGFTWASKGINALYSSPLFSIFLLTLMVFALQNYGLSREMDDRTTPLKKALAIGLLVVIVLLALSAVLHFLLSGRLEGISIAFLLLFTAYFAVTVAFLLYEKFRKKD